MRQQRTIAVFGITANPPHFGHINAIEQALVQCTEVWVSPVYKHPFGKSFISYEHRLAMLEMILPAKKGIHLAELDHEYYSTYMNMPYSYELLKHVEKTYSGTVPKLVIGEDNYKPQVWQKFHKYDSIEQEFGVIVVRDKGVHSTQVRQLCQAQKFNEVEDYCGPDVTQYIIEHKLYQIGD